MEKENINKLQNINNAMKKKVGFVIDSNSYISQFFNTKDLKGDNISHLCSNFGVTTNNA